jgi:hypothetical protein
VKFSQSNLPLVLSRPPSLFALRPCASPLPGPGAHCLHFHNSTNMSRLNTDLVAKACKVILDFSAGKKVTCLNGEEKEGKVRKFQETVELQITLKNYDATKDKRFNGSFKLPHVPRPNYKVCVLANAVHEEKCKSEGIEYMNVDMLKKLNKDKKVRTLEPRAFPTPAIAVFRNGARATLPH